MSVTPTVVHRPTLPRRLFWALIVVGLVAAIVSAANRWRVEQANRSVEIALDYAELRTLAANSNQSRANVLNRFRTAGATSLLVSEETIGGLEDSHRIEVAENLRDQVVLRLKDRKMQARITEALTRKRGWKIKTAETPESVSLIVSEPLVVVRGVGLGLDPETVHEASVAKLQIIGRIADWQGAQPQQLRWTLERLKAQNVTSLIFLGDEVLGYKGYVIEDKTKPETDNLERMLRDLRMNYGTVEFGKQKGDPQLIKAAADRTVRVHTILSTEMATSTIPDAIQRFLLAARERNLRILFVRLFETEPEPLEANSDYVEKIAKGLVQGGLETGTARPFAPLGVPIVLRLLIGIGLAGAWLLLLDSITRFTTDPTDKTVKIVAYSGAFVLTVLPILPTLWGVKLDALASACLLPTLGLVRDDLLKPIPTGRSLWQTILGRFFGACAITLIGAAFIVGLLADRIFLIKADVFAGIKATEIVPVLLVAILYGLRLRATDTASWSDVLRDAGLRINTFLRQPILYGQTLILFFALAIAVLLVLRSGNEPGVGVSAFELKSRALLDRLLYARPRFKEFLIGHPAFIVALFIALRNVRTALTENIAFAVLLIGAIGQVSLLNTFCHLHTPILVSLWRAGLGIVIGVGIGMMAAFILQTVLRRAEKESAAVGNR